MVWGVGFCWRFGWKVVKGEESWELGIRVVSCGCGGENGKVVGDVEEEGYGVVVG